MENTKIEWATHTFNAWEGCTKVSPGCANCYAATRNARFGGGTAPNWGPGAPRRRTSQANWNKVAKWNREAKKAHAKRAIENTHYNDGMAPRVFVNSLADWLDPEVPVLWLADLLNQILLAPHLNFLLLTKRPELWSERVFQVWYDGPGLSADLYDWVKAWDRGTPPHNVWIGTTVEDQKRADERIPHLRNIPARVRFLSCEPLLGPVDLRTWLGDQRPNPLHWVIAGGESGPGARPMHPDWAKNLRDQCQAAGVAFFFKQWGEWLPDNQRDWRANLGEHQFALLNPDGTRLDPKSGHNSPTAGLLRVGKARAGRLLDGVEWSQFPEVRP